MSWNLETIITSSTHRPDGFEDPIVERMFHRLREVKQKQIGQPPPSSVEEMSRFLVLSCIDFINSLGWKDFAPNLAADKFSKEDIGSKPIKSLYADKINQAVSVISVLQSYVHVASVMFFSIGYTRASQF